MDIYTLTWKYFSAFESKDLSALTNIYDQHVVLKDWDIECNGAEKVLAANESLFTSAANIKVDITRCSVDNMLQTATAEITINIDGEEILVADVITFTGEGKIKNIRAYKG
tara:strand:+ start:498 stop:830 length:333 start_codon:yes stop_codon:yes gene_type:complete